MKISIDIKRVFLTAIACRAAAIIPPMLLTLRKGNMQNFIEVMYFILVPLLFSLAITLTSFDRIKSKKKVQIILLNILLTTFSFFLFMYLSVTIEKAFSEAYSFSIICILSGLSILYINNICIKINNTRIGVFLLSLFALVIPPITNKFSGDFATFFVIWQTIIGFALAIIIWLEIETQQSKQVDR